MRKVLLNITKVAMVLGTVLSLGLTGVSAQAEIMPGEELEKIEVDAKAKEKVLVIDVRPTEEYEEGHLPHAINIPFDKLEENLDKLEDFKEFPIIVYCNTGKKSAESAQLLLDNDFKDVKDAVGVKEFEYTLVTYASILPAEFIEAAKEGEATFIDVRDAKDFEAGSVEGALNANVDKMEEILTELPEDKEAEIITFCYSGNKSATLADFLEKEGYTNVRNSLDGTKENEELLKAE